MFRFRHLSFHSYTPLLLPSATVAQVMLDLIEHRHQDVPVHIDILPPKTAPVLTPR